MCRDQTMLEQSTPVSKAGDSLMALMTCHWCKATKLGRLMPSESP